MSSTKTSKKKIPKSINEMSKEMLQETLKKKRECNAKALYTVERLCEENVEEEYFLENLQFINQTHFNDVTVERAISKLCGYPLCKEKLGKVPSQQYHISTRYNKVFDITERKNFCSSTCYKSATYVKNQLFTSPLWYRDQEIIPKYAVLKSSKSSLGEEVVLISDKIKVDDDDDKSDSKMKTSNKATNFDESIKKLNEECKNLSLNDCDVLSERLEKSDNTKNENSNNLTLKKNEDDTNSLQKEEKNEETKENKNITQSKKIGTSDTVINKPEEKQKILSSKNKSTKQRAKIKTEHIDSVSKVEKSVFEWFSVDSMFYLFKQEKLKEIFSDKMDKLKDVFNSKSSSVGFSEKIDKMIHLFALLDTDFDSNDTKGNLKPLPDYSVLKEEGKSLEIKVRAFYKGELEVKQPVKDEKEKEKEENETDTKAIYLPLIDAHAQVSLRRKIVLDKLNKILPDLLRIFSTDYVLQMSDIRNLVSTFSLSPHNVTFKPTEWYLLGIILLKLLSLKDKHLETVLNLESSQDQIKQFLSNYELKEDYIDVLIKRLTDSTNILQKFDENSS